MKKILMTTLFLGSLSTVQADNYAYLNIVKSDGSGITLPANGTTITFSDGYLVVNGEKIPLSELSVMRFSNEMTGTGISNLDRDNLNPGEADAIYDLNGRQIPSKAQLKEGVYIIKKGNKTHKIIIQ